MQRFAAGQGDGAEGAGDTAQLAADAQAFIELNGAVLVGNGVNRANQGAGCIFAVVAHLGRRLMAGLDQRQARLCLETLRLVLLRAGGHAGIAPDAQSGIRNHKAVHVMSSETDYKKDPPELSINRANYIDIIYFI
ncbi:hypothetical protein EDWATA_00595 [Edwardsiella tarda ATCC 23685]|uniref:Uncharacterized protein n=1 Tax=Edwardsiella tarda ATCC 23685 TaxID=500638 RepID=D4F1K2_EDWTA|nr:hypothetical protein EDWATA_00595 [Edwardsiella tarda ATCC 23685]